MDSTRDSNLQTFLQRHGSRLPSTIKLVDGFCGTNAEDTLEGDQILVIYKIERQNTIIALDQLDQEICVPRNTKNKVQLLPFEHHGEHKRVRQLFNAHQTQYFRVIEELASLQISSETTLQLLSNQPFPNFAKCKVVDLYDSREVLLPLELEGRFQPLLDAREYYLEEVLAQYQLPVNIRFALPSRANDGACLSHPLSGLENIHLERETEVEMIFAASLDDPLSLNLFPSTLDIHVSVGFRVTADTSKKIKECRQTLAASERTLKRLDIIASNSYYFKVCPVRRFNFESLQPPSISQTTKERKAESLSKAKQNKTGEQTAINGETLPMSRFAQYPQSVSKPGCSSEEHAADYENCEIDESFNNSVRPEARKAVEEGIDEVPVLPPKTFTRTSRSTIPKDTTRANQQNRLVPKPRKRRNVAMTRNQENVNNGVSQAQSLDRNLPEWTGSFSGDDDEDTCPELPPRPEFLKIRSIEDKEDDDVSREERPPPLPPRCPGPNQFGFPAYLVVDVTDWRAVDERAFRPNAQDDVLYSYAKDDGHVFKQDSFRLLDLSLMYSPDESKAYIDMESPGVNGRYYVDMEYHEKMEMHGRRSDRENSHKKDFIQPDETGTSEELENSQLRKARRENGNEAAEHLQEESSDEDHPYEEIEEQHESSQRKNPSEENAANQERAKVERPSKNPRSKTTQGSFDKGPSRAAIATCPINQSRGIIISGRRDEDWMDFRDIEHFLKLKKQLSEALAKKVDLEKQVAVTGQSLTAENQTQQPPTSLTSDHNGNAPPHMDKTNSFDENHNRLDSSREFCNHSQRGTQAVTRSESVSNRERDDHETGEMQKNPSLSSLEADDFQKKKPSLSSLAPKNVVPDNESYHQKSSLTSVKELDDSDDDDDYEECHQKSSLTSVKELDDSDDDDDYEECHQKSSLTSVKELDDSDDDDDYEECHNREYVNHQTEVNYSFEKEFHDHYENVDKQQQTGNDMEDAEDGINTIYYNTVEFETYRDRTLTSLYLQLDNPNDEEDNVYVNDDSQESDKGLAMIKAEGNQPATFKAITAEIETSAREDPPNAVGCIEEPPPLPPKQLASSLRDTE